MYIIVGRTALNHATGEHAPTNDLDLIGDDLKEFPPDRATDYHLIPRNILEEFTTYNHYADLDSLYTLKLSHAEYNIHWWKTIQDILFMKKCGARLKPKLLSLLKEHWKGVHGDKSFLNLGRTSKEFFNDYVPKKFEHDWLHTVISYPNKPIYLSCLKEGQEVQTDWIKFKNLPLQTRIDMLKEEICTIATERWLLNGFDSPLRAYQMALQKTVTNLTKGKTSQFIIENIEHFLKPLPNWIDNLERFELLKTSYK